MSVYRPFERHDILFSTINTRPRVSVAFGSGNLWRGSTGASASLSLYGGVRSRFDVKKSDFASSGLSIYPLDQLDTHSIDKVIFVSGSYPSTGSIRFVRCSDEPAPEPHIQSVTNVRWYDEHFRPVWLLYDYYQSIDSCYFTGSYDAYDVMFLADRNSATKPGSYFVFSGSNNLKVATSTGSFTAEAWYKPMLTGAVPNIMGQPNVWSMGVSTLGRLVFRNDRPGNLVITGTMPGQVRQGSWNHLAVVVTTGSYVTFFVNGQNAGTTAIANLSGADQPVVVGALVSASIPLSSSDGFIFETRLWNVARTQAQISAGLSGTLIDSGSTGLIHYARFNDGPLSTRHGFAAGSGAFDYSRTAAHGQVVQYSGPQTAHWQPNDHETFQFNLNITGTLTDMRLFHVPSMFYGKQIEPGSVRVTDGVYNHRKVVRVFQDDGRGGLYVSGSMTRDISGEEYTGNPRRKVGNVFYTEGLVVFTDPALWDMFDTTSDFWSPVQTGSFPDLLALDFNGQGKVYTKTFNCRLPTAQANASNNPTFSVLDDRGTSDLDDDIRRAVRDDGTTYITSIGLYNEDRVLVAVAKLAQPLRKREKDKQNIRLKMDF